MADRQSRQSAALSSPDKMGMHPLPTTPTTLTTTTLSMIAAPVNLGDEATSQLKIWSTEPHARFNDQELTIMRLEGQFYWHTHPDSDEMFLIIDGDVFVETREGSNDISEQSEAPLTSRWLRKGDVFVVPQGTAHRSAAPEGASVMFGLKKGRCCS